jgi:hypothetical protein
LIEKDFGIRIFNVSELLRHLKRHKRGRGNKHARRSCIPVSKPEDYATTYAAQEAFHDWEGAFHLAKCADGFAEVGLRQLWDFRGAGDVDEVDDGSSH